MVKALEQSPVVGFGGRQANRIARENGAEDRMVQLLIVVYPSNRQHDPSVLFSRPPFCERLDIECFGPYRS